MSLRALFGLALAISMTAMTAGAAGGLAGGEAPDFVLPSTEGPNIRLSELRGQIVLLAFAAARCGDCGAELEGLAETYERYRDAGVALLLVSLDRDPRDARGMTQAAAAAYPVLSDVDGRVGRAYAVDAIPALVLIDRDGVVRDEYEGRRRGEEPEYLAKLRELLREP